MGRRRRCQPLAGVSVTDHEPWCFAPERECRCLAPLQGEDTSLPASLLGVPEAADGHGVVLPED